MNFNYDNILPIILMWSYILTKCWIVTLIVFIILVRFVYSPTIEYTQNPSIFASPCDGYVKSINTFTQKETQMTRITVFLTLFNNHTQYIPYDCIVNDIQRVSGGYVPAYQEHSINNEKVITKCAASKFSYEIHQVTGLLTRRIFNYLGTSQSVKAGDKIGFIMLGSRVDIVLPSNVIKRINVNIGDHIYPAQQIIELNETFY